MNCPNCHRPTDGAARFCKYCGAPLPEEKTASGCGRKKPALWIALGLVACALIAFGIRQAVLRANYEKITPGKLQSLVSVIEDTEAQAEDYFELYFDGYGKAGGLEAASDFAVDLEVAANRVIREQIYMRNTFEGYTSRRGWDPEKYGDYEELYEACAALCDHVEEHDFDDPDGARETYEELLESYRKCLRRVS